METAKKKKILYWTGGTVLVIIVALIGASEYFINYALNNGDRNYNLEAEIDTFKTDYPYAAEWMDSIRSTKALRDTFQYNRDGLKIHAWFLASPDSTNHTAVIVHGYKSNPIEMMQIGYMYNHDLHWNILLPDNIAHGQSEGKWIGMGWKDRLDILQWCRVAKSIFPSSDEVVHGISMGAATTMCVSGEDTPDYIKGFVEDCGYSSVWDEYVGEMKKQFGLPSFPLLNIVSVVNKIQNGWSFTEASPEKQVAKCTKPMLFIHGDNDDYVPTRMIDIVYAAKAQGIKDKWLAPGSAHADSYKDHPEEYTAKVKQFLSTSVLNH